MSIINKIKPKYLIVLLISVVIGGVGSSLFNTHGSTDHLALWDILKSQEYRQVYMETKLECLDTMPSTGLSESVVDMICIDKAHTKAKAAYCEGKDLPICESTEK